VVQGSNPSAAKKQNKKQQQQKGIIQELPMKPMNYL
jgi:hypothetical protein